MSKPGVLELVGAQLVDEADAAAFLGEVEQHAATRGGDRGDGALQLLAAIAAEARQHVAGEAFGMEPHEHAAGRVGRPDQDRQMLGAAVPRTECDEARILGVGQRHARLGDPLELGDRRAPVEHRGHVDDGKIGAPPRQRRLGRHQPQDQRRGQQIGQFRQGHRGERAGFGACRLGSKPRRLGAKGGGRIGELADHRGRKLRRDGRP